MRRLLSVLLLLVAGLVQAQPYPSRPITMVLGFPPGGSLDPIARQVAQGMQKELGQNVVVENRPGASGTLAAAGVARAQPDGYTLLFGVAGNLVVAPASMKQVPYDPSTAFVPVSLIARGPYVLMAHAGLPVQDVAELARAAKASPGQLNYGSAGIGSVQHFAGELLNRATGATLTHIPYKGGGQAWPALMSGEIHALFDTMPGPSMFIGTGKVRPLAVTGSKRLTSMPEVRTFAEQGYPSVDVSFMYGVLAPAGTPRDIVAKLNAAVHRALAEPELLAAMRRQEVEPSPGTPAAFGELITSELRRWREIVVQTNFKPE